MREDHGHASAANYQARPQIVAEENALVVPGDPPVCACCLARRALIIWLKLSTFKRKPQGISLIRIELPCKYHRT